MSVVSPTTRVYAPTTTPGLSLGKLLKMFVRFSKIRQFGFLAYMDHGAL